VKDSSPPAVTLGEGPGWRLRQDRDGELRMHLAHWSNEAEQALREWKAAHIIQTASWAEGPPVLRRLVDFAPQIRSLTTIAAAVPDVACIGELVMLEQLILQHRDPGIDYSRLTKLRELFLWDKATPGRVAEAPALSMLQLSKLKIHDLRGLEGCPSLRKLMLMRMGSLKSLAGIERLPLESLTVTYGARFGSFAPIASLAGLRTLSIDGNSKVEDIDAIAGLTRLEVLAIENGPAIPAVELLGASPAMQSIAMIGTEVGTGPASLAPLARLGSLMHLTLRGRPKSLRNLTDIPLLGEVTTLELLSLDRVADLASVAWIRPLERLRHLAISGTRILDGDLTPIMKLPSLTFLGLDIAGFTPGGKRYRPEYGEVLAPSRNRARQVTAAE
jgi:hypothetical protein